MRFSKETFLNYLAHEMNKLQERHGFDPANGLAQVHISGLDEAERAYHYGRFSMLQDLIEEIEMGMPFVPPREAA